jgi:sarcosine/dimethylglycine N-methyltransferase
MSEQQTNVVNVTRDYYNSDDADQFYFTVWGGEDIHIGLYKTPDESISDASRRTVEVMAGKVDGLGSDSRVLDVGAGYGGAARQLAAKFRCRVTALNLSEVENVRNRQMNAEQGLDTLIEVVDGSFESLPFEDAQFDLVWSQDAILHSGDRERVLREIARVLKPGGRLVFTDPMKDDGCPDSVLQPILDRIHLETLGSPGFYKQAGQAAGLELIAFDDYSPQLTRHYTRVLEETKRRDQLGDLKGLIGDDYLERMKKGLSHWIDGGNASHLAWGIFLFQKP